MYSYPQVLKVTEQPPKEVIQINTEGTEVIVEFTPTDSSKSVVVDTLSVITCGRTGKYNGNMCSIFVCILYYLCSTLYIY
jgi:hypothetical protein